MSTLIPSNDFAEITQLIESAKQRVYRTVNTELIELYWAVGEYVSQKIAADAWGKGTVELLAAYIQQRQPNLRGFSAKNIWRMRQFFDAYRDSPILSAVLRELPWTHNLTILSRSKRSEEREFYLKMAVQEKWSSRELERQFNNALFERIVLNPGKVSPLVTQTLLRHSRMLLSEIQPTRLSRMFLSGIQRVCCSIKSQFSDLQCYWIPASAGMTAKRIAA